MGKTFGFKAAVTIHESLAEYIRRSRTGGSERREVHSARRRVPLGHKMSWPMPKRFAAAFRTVGGDIPKPPFHRVELLQVDSVPGVDMTDSPAAEAILSAFRPEYVVNGVGVIKQRGDGLFASRIRGFSISVLEARASAPPVLLANASHFPLRCTSRHPDTSGGQCYDSA